MPLRLVLIAAVARQGVIGRDNQLLWHLPEDLKRFKALTLGHTVIMGRKTWDSLPEKFRPLPGRRNIVISRNPAWQAEGAPDVLCAASLDAAIALAGEGTAFVIGGAQIYALALARADALELTEIDADFLGDAYFPAIDPALWRVADQSSHTAAEGYAYRFVRYERAR